MKRYKNFKYKVRRGTVHIMEYLGQKETLVKAVIPSEIDGLKVVFISRWTFDECENLEEIEIPQYINKIAEGAFLHTLKLKKIRIHQDNLVYTFQDGLLIENGYKLHSYLNPDRHNYLARPINNLHMLEVIEIEEKFFFDYQNVISLSIPNDVKKIGAYAFAFCGDLTEIIIPDSVTEIGISAFWRCVSLKSITIPRGIKIIKEETFAYCDSLKEVIIEGGLKIIKDEAFSMCDNLRTLSLPNSIQRIGDSSFCACGALKEIKMPSSIKEIDINSFACCDKLEKVQLSPTIKKIPEGAFCSCHNLESITIPPSVEIIEERAFGYSDSFLSVTVLGFDTIIVKTAFEYRDYYEIYCYMNSAAHVFAKENAIPVSFLDYDGAEENSEISPRYKKRTITQEALLFCKEFETIYIPKMEITIGDCVFKGDNNLFEVKISNSVMHIQENAFAFFKKINKVYVPKSVVKIEEFAFFGCSNLTEIIIEGENTYISSMAFGTKKSCTIFCKKGSIAFSFALEQGMKVALI